MDTGCVELLLRDGRKISIDCTGVEDALDVTMAQRSELDYLIYNDPLGYADLILNGDPEGYLKIDDCCTLVSLNQWAQGSSPWRCTTSTKSELFSDRRRVRIFCILRKTERIPCFHRKTS